MDFLFILLVYVEVVLSNSFPNVCARGAETLSTLNAPASRDTSLTVYPFNPEDSWQLLESHKFLQSPYGKENVKSNPQEGDLSWSISLQDGDIIDALQGHPGIQLEKETEESKRAALVRRENASYIAIAANPEDDGQTKATLEFIKTKIKNPNERIIELHKPGTDHVMGWGHLQFTSEAKAAGEAYEGIKALADDYPADDERAR
ncbi:hypothetical protein BU26DRAFT_561320 [Trematosphaeria pertusa]|uniref:Uncharacterized protein n=1 Tax=Trematosphaeria pertusa TaxID=390896 RepID=A0A6A6IUD5_9PLEO|nr:uncharacterized protein BU26DRAFT_561320 [Trematosphaeria pertusa]KAF2254064.1 hypothetical protein BU26DRAFT_561320 [Trematosphaeria pertusa]